MGNSFTLLLLFGAAVTVVFLAFQRPILYLFGASDATYPYASAYMTIYLLGSIFCYDRAWYESIYQACRGFGRTGMMTVGLGALVNIVLDPVFIFGLNMGVRGGGLGHGDRAGLFCALGAAVSYRAKSPAAPAPQILASACRPCAAHCCVGAVRLFV